MSRTARLIFNPAAGPRGRGPGVEAVLAALRSGGLDAEAAPTAAPGHATELAAEAARAGVEVAVAWGGDGTVREVTTGLLGTRTALGIVPGGTTNVVAIAFGLPSKALPAAARLGALPARPIDVGLCGGQPFLMQASSGPEAHLMERVAGSRLKAWLGLPGVILASVPVLLRYRFPEVVVRADGELVRCTGAMVCNISEVAGPYRVAPDGRFDDGQLELLVFRGRGLWATAGFAFALFFGRHLRRADTELRPVRHVVFEPSPGARLQLDGDAIDVPRPAETHLAPQRLLALVDAR